MQTGIVTLYTPNRKRGTVDHRMSPNTRILSRSELAVYVLNTTDIAIKDTSMPAVVWRYIYQFDPFCYCIQHSLRC